MNIYKELRNKHSEEVNNFPMFFAFSDSQFEEGMKKIGLTVTDTDKIYSLGGGGYYKKTDAKAFSDMLETHKKELNESIENDKTGEGFIYDMFYFELCNHEYGYTYEIDDTIDSLNLTMEFINENENVLNALKKACSDIKKEDN